jgi:hypothetical protein
MTYNWCTLLEMSLLPVAKSLGLSCGLTTVASMSGFPRISSNSSSLFCLSSVAVRLTGEFTSLEEPTDDPDVVILSALLADEPDFAGSERRVEPEGPM